MIRKKLSFWTYALVRVWSLDEKKKKFPFTGAEVNRVISVPFKFTVERNAQMLSRTGA